MCDNGRIHQSPLSRPTQSPRQWRISHRTTGVQCNMYSAGQPVNVTALTVPPWTKAPGLLQPELPQNQRWKFLGEATPNGTLRRRCGQPPPRRFQNSNPATHSRSSAQSSRAVTPRSWLDLIVANRGENHCQQTVEKTIVNKPCVRYKPLEAPSR